jgi:DNA-binding GntR family transcriptional regulator
MVLVRRPLRTDVHQEILERILRAELRPGARVRDAQLAQDLGVSRTPVREALLRLERDGFLEASVGRGFTVRPLTDREVREVYPLIWTLEGLALRSSAPPSRAALAELDAVTSAIERTPPEVAACIALDTHWHRLLLAGCPNARLLGMIADLKEVARRYEFAYMRVPDLVSVSVRDHREVVKAFAEGRVERAAALLEGHWRFSMQALLDQLEPTADAVRPAQPRRAVVARARASSRRARRT